MQNSTSTSRREKTTPWSLEWIAICYVWPCSYDTYCVSKTTSSSVLGARYWRGSDLLDSWPVIYFFFFIFLFLIAHSFSVRLCSFLFLLSLSFFSSHSKINLIDSLPRLFLPLLSRSASLGFDRTMFAELEDIACYYTILYIFYSYLFILKLHCSIHWIH